MKCSATATNGGVVNGGTITWTNVKLNTPDENSPFKASYKITCTYQRDFQPAINEKLTLTAPGHVPQDNNTLGDTQVGNYTIGGTLPSGTPTPKPPVKDKDTNGGLAKTGF